MAEFVNRAGLRVATTLADFIEREALPGLGIDAAAFWKGAADIFARFTPENRALLAKRDELQTAIDAWHQARRGKPIDGAEYRSFLPEHRLPRPRTRALQGHQRKRRRRSRPHGRPAACRAHPQRPLPAQRRQCPLGQPLRRALRHRRPSRQSQDPAATTQRAAPKSSPAPKPSSTKPSPSPAAGTPTLRAGA